MFPDLTGETSDIEVGADDIAAAPDLYTVALLVDVIMNHNALPHGLRTALAAHFNGNRPNMTGYLRLLDSAAKTGKITMALKNQLIVAALLTLEGLDDAPPDPS